MNENPGENRWRNPKKDAKPIHRISGEIDDEILRISGECLTQTQQTFPGQKSRSKFQRSRS